MRNFILVPAFLKNLLAEDIYTLKGLWGWSDSPMQAIFSPWILCAVIFGYWVGAINSSQLWIYTGQQTLCIVHFWITVLTNNVLCDNLLQCVVKITQLGLDPCVGQVCNSRQTKVSQCFWKSPRLERPSGQKSWPSQSCLAFTASQQRWENEMMARMLLHSQQSLTTL